MKSNEVKYEQRQHIIKLYLRITYLNSSEERNNCGSSSEVRMFDRDSYFCVFVFK